MNYSYANLSRLLQLHVESIRDPKMTGMIMGFHTDAKGTIVTILMTPDGRLRPANLYDLRVTPIAVPKKNSIIDGG